jgi:hypothetical protein
MVFSGADDGGIAGGQTPTSEVSNRPTAVSRRIFVRRAAQVGAVATAVAWTAPGMTSIALARNNDPDAPGSGPPRTNPGTTEETTGAGGGNTTTTKDGRGGGTTTTQSSSPDQGGQGSTTTGGGGNGGPGTTLDPSPSTGGSGVAGDSGGGGGGGAGGGASTTTTTTPGAGGSLPFTGGDAKDTAVLGLAAVVVGRVLYEMRHLRDDDADPTANNR